MNAIKAMKDLIIRLNQTTEKLTAATSCLETSNASETCRMLAKMANSESKGLLVQFDEWAEQTKQPASQNDEAGALVLFDMNVYQVKGYAIHGKILTRGNAGHDFGDRLVTDPDHQTFPLTLEGLNATLECKKQYDDLLFNRPLLNQDAIRDRLTLIWFTIMSSLNQPESRMQATNEFTQFVEAVERKYHALEESTIDGVQIIA